MAEIIIVLIIVAIGAVKLWRDITAKGEENWFNQPEITHAIAKVVVSIIVGFFYMIYTLAKWGIKLALGSMK